MRLFVGALRCFFLIPFSLGRELHVFTNQDGKKIEAELVDLDGGSVKLRMHGKLYDVPIATLSDEDQKFLQYWDLKRQGIEEDPYYSEIVFQDDFSGEGFKEDWRHYKSDSVIHEGVLIGKTIDINAHAGVDSIRFEGQKDMEVSVKFKFAGPTAYRFNVWFDDKEWKESHAGHICSVAVTPKEISIQDAKTGNMRLDIREKRKGGEPLDEETLKMLEEKIAKFPIDLEDSTDWHELLIRTKDDVVTVTLDGEKIGDLQSEGLAHPTKSLVSLTTNEDDVHYDNFLVKAAPAP